LRTHDWNMLNNDRRFGFSLKTLVAGPGQVAVRLDNFVTEPVYRDRLAIGFAPTAWYNSAGGLTIGWRERSNYLGRFALSEFQHSYGTGLANETNTDVKQSDFAFRFRNPTWLRAPGLSLLAEGMRVEGRGAARLGADWNLNRSLQSRTEPSVGLQVQWVGVTDPAFLESGAYSDGGSAELEVHGSVRASHGRWLLSAKTSLAGGGLYQHPGIGAPAGAGSELAAYGRGTFEGIAKRQLGTRFTLGARLFALESLHSFAWIALPPGGCALPRAGRRQRARARPQSCGAQPGRAQSPAGLPSVWPAGWRPVPQRLARALQRRSLW
jgi:hypothetical protein